MAGKYDLLAENLIRQLDAEAVVVIVMGGPKGNGMSLSARAGVGLRDPVGLARVLRHAADEIQGRRAGWYPETSERN